MVRVHSILPKGIVVTIPFLLPRLKSTALLRSTRLLARIRWGSVVRVHSILPKGIVVTIPFLLPRLKSTALLRSTRLLARIRWGSVVRVHLSPTKRNRYDDSFFVVSSPFPLARLCNFSQQKYPGRIACARLRSCSARTYGICPVAIPLRLIVPPSVSANLLRPIVRHGRKTIALAGEV